MTKCECGKILRGWISIKSGKCQNCRDLAQLREMYNKGFSDGYAKAKEETK